MTGRSSERDKLPDSVVRDVTYVICDWLSDNCTVHALFARESYVAENVHICHIEYIWQV